MNYRTLLLLLIPSAIIPTLSGVTPTKTPASTKKAKAKPASVTKSLTTTSVARKPAKKRRYYNPWTTPTFADSTIGDNVDGEDLVVRRAAVEALGNYNGSVVVADPNTGRVLTMVNQKLALTGAYTPCSTIKLVSGLAGLSEGYIDRETNVRLNRWERMNLTTALARSNNPYFQKIGYGLGFEKIKSYAHMVGLGEKAGLGIDGEVDGTFPGEPVMGIPIGLMCSHGAAIGMTPLQLTAIMSAFANGGTLYYLQYPRTPEDLQNLVPRVKRQLDIQQWLPELKPGLAGAVEFGTAKKAALDSSEPLYGKTGTCSDGPTHLGWFTSFYEIGNRKLVVTVLLTGGRPINGPVASGVAGQVYRNLAGQQYFAHQPALSPAMLVNGGQN
jgi:cell division protein FtsI/penicillin-binding protein 2